jgi:RNA polymerase sigma factor (sigma-70 family)
MMQAASGAVAQDDAVLADSIDFSTAYAEHYSAAVRWATALLLNEDLARDVVQESFLRIFSQIRAIRDPAAFPGYLRRTIVRSCASRWRAQARERARDRRLEASSLRIVTPPDVDPALLTAVQRLPERQRLVIILRYWLDWTERDIAAALRCQPGTVKSLSARALHALREEVAR